MSGFMDTFFFISLGITFVLILLLVYHFKQRLSVTEQKCDTMFEIINGMATEMTSIKSVLMSRPIYPPNMPQGNTGGRMFSQQGGNPEPVIVHQGDNELTLVNDDVEEETDLDGESDSGEESGEESDDDSDDESDAEEEGGKTDKLIFIEEDTHKIMVSDGEDDPMVVEEIFPEVTPALQVTRIPVDVSTTEKYSKMSLTQLKSIAVERGFVENASKMKKTELVELLESR